MSTKTPNYQLNQWDPSDQFRRTDFNEDNAKLDAALTAKAASSDVSALARRVAALEAAVAGVPKIKTGTYAGDGQGSRVISLGFTPKAVLVLTRSGRVSYSGSNESYTLGGLAVSGSSLIDYMDQDALAVTSGGFTVSTRDGWSAGTHYHTDLNGQGQRYHYIAIG